MGSHGIKDRVAIVGMGCTPFGEHWDKSTDDLLIDSTQEAFGSVGVTKDDIDAYWLGTMGSGVGGPDAVASSEARLQAGRRASRTCARPDRRRSATRATRSHPVRTTSSWPSASRS